MATAREGLVGAGTQTSGLGFGGYTTTFVANTEEYMIPVLMCGQNGNIILHIKFLILHRKMTV
jgi:hypothetical protein